MLYNRLWKTAQECLDFFGYARTRDGKVGSEIQIFFFFGVHRKVGQGVTIPSQRRFVFYFEKLLQSGPVPLIQVNIKRITIHTIPLIRIDNSCCKFQTKSGVLNFFLFKVYDSFFCKNQIIQNRNLHIRSIGKRLFPSFFYDNIKVSILQEITKEPKIQFNIPNIVNYKILTQFFLYSHRLISFVACFWISED